MAVAYHVKFLASVSSRLHSFSLTPPSSFQHFLAYIYSLYRPKTVSLLTNGIHTIQREIPHQSVTDVVTQIDITDIYRTFLPNTKENTFSTPYETFFKIGYILCYKASINRYNIIEITTYILSEHHGVILDFNNKRKPTNSWKLNDTLLSYHWVKNEIKK